MASLRNTVRSLAYAGGMLGLRHGMLHHATLTVVMFHRVTIPGSFAATSADPRYAIPAPLFAACLRFFRRYYNIVGLDVVRASSRGHACLPPHALLITFDDGWQDNLSVALPILQQHDLTAAVFVAADVLDQSVPWWWQEILLRSLREKQASWDELWALTGGGDAPGGDRDLVLLTRYAALTPALRLRLIGPLAKDVSAEGRHMIGNCGLKELAAAGIGLGAHGATHVPLSMMAHPEQDLARARGILEPETQASGLELDALSFPHGRYDLTSLHAARATGFSVLFTSDPCLNAAPQGQPSSLLGRIPIEAATMTSASGRFSPARLATWLFHRPVRWLVG